MKASLPWPLVVALIALGGCTLDQAPARPDAGRGAQAGQRDRSAVPPAGSSREDDCRGPADLCKQDSAR